jgi:hypothetical protein
MAIAEDTAIDVQRHPKQPPHPPFHPTSFTRAPDSHHQTPATERDGAKTFACLCIQQMLYNHHHLIAHQSSGVAVNPECLDLYQELKLRKKHKYIIFGLNKDKTEIVNLKTETSTDYDVFLADLPEDQCRWAVYDLEFEKEGGGQRNKIVFYQWYILPSL